jgi:hypothetical protein
MKRLIGALCFVVACGGAAAPAESTTPAATGAGASSAPEMSPHVQNVNPSDSREVRMNAARGDFDRAESQVGAATSDCATACRALESMERAAEHLCAIDSGGECGRARERLEAARERVRASCGGCR